MDRGEDVRQWDEMARHLVQAHGGNPDALISYAPTLEQIRFAHADTHLALADDDIPPPDGHAHAGPAEPGHPYARDLSCRPFPPAPSAPVDGTRTPYFGWEMCLPQTMRETGVPSAWQAADPWAPATEGTSQGTGADGPETEAGT
jgi:hypothetical protein